MNGGAGKGDKPRPRRIPYELYSMRWDLAFGRISREQYLKHLAEQEQVQDEPKQEELVNES